MNSANNCLVIHTDRNVIIDARIVASRDRDADSPSPPTTLHLTGDRNLLEGIVVRNHANTATR
jgi:hypothetical protein